MRYPSEHRTARHGLLPPALAACLLAAACGPAVGPGASEPAMTPEQQLGRAQELVATAVFDTLQGNDETARTKLLEALEIGRELSHPGIQAMALTGLGTIQRNMQDYEAALASFVEASLVIERGFGPEDSSLDLPLMSIGDIYAQLERYDESREHYRRALAVISKHRGSRSAEAADVYFSLGRVSFIARDYEDAIEQCGRAAAIYEAMGAQGTDEYERIRLCIADSERGFAGEHVGP